MSDGVSLRRAFPLLDYRALVNDPASYFECGSAVGRTTEKRLLNARRIVVGDSVDHATTLPEANLELTGTTLQSLEKASRPMCDPGRTLKIRLRPLLLPSTPKTSRGLPAQLSLHPQR